MGFPSPLRTMYCERESARQASWAGRTQPACERDGATLSNPTRLPRGISCAGKTVGGWLCHFSLSDIVMITKLSDNDFSDLANFESFKASVW